VRLACGLDEFAVVLPAERGRRYARSMTADDGTALGARATRELADQGKDDLTEPVSEAIRSVAASHAGRALDEVESVLNQAIHGATGLQSLLSVETVRGLAQRISESKPHA
jgi:hypothetical protein